VEEAQRVAEGCRRYGGDHWKVARRRLGQEIANALRYGREHKLEDLLERLAGAEKRADRETDARHALAWRLREHEPDIKGVVYADAPRLREWFQAHPLGEDLR